MGRIQHLQIVYAVTAFARALRGAWVEVGTQTSNRNDVIDAFRGISIVAVMAYRYTVRWTTESPRDLIGYAHDFSPAFALGAYGVHLFFVISGLVITMTVLRSESVLEFAIRRFARLWPALFVAATITFLACQFGPEELRRDTLDYFASLTFLPAFLGQEAVDGAYWSLHVEVLFYCVVALSYLALRERFWIGVLAVALFSVVPGLPGVVKSLLFAEYWPYFLAGMAGWYGLFEKRWRTAGFLGAGAAVTFAMVHPAGAAGWLVVSGAAAMFALIALGHPIPLGPLPALGRASYSLYLLHQTLGVMLIGVLVRAGASDGVAIGFTGAATLLLAEGMRRLVERPGQRLVMKLRRSPVPQGLKAAA